MSEVLSYSQFQEAMDAVNPKAVKKKFKNRKDKDIDNDGDVDSSDKYLHKRRKAISKAVKKDDVQKEGAFYGRDDLVKKFASKNPKDYIKLRKTVMTKDGKPGGTEGVSMKRKGNEDKIAKYKKDGYKEVPMGEEKKCPPGQYYCEKSGKCKPNSMKEDSQDVLKRMMQTRDNLKKQGNSAGLAAMELRIKKFRDSMKKEEKLNEKGKGLYYNINKKRKEGRPMRKKGEKGAPSEDDFKSAAKTAKESQEWERENCHSKDHDCATLVEHIVWGIGKPLFERHAVPDDSGYVAWYDIEFEHGVESAVPTEDLKIYTTEAHERKHKDKKKMLPAKKGKHADEVDEESYSDAEIAKAVDIAKKMAGSNYTGAHNAIEKMKKGLASVGKVRYALKKAAENFETWKGLSISEVNNIVQDITSSAQDYIKLVEDGDLKSVNEPEVEPVKGMPLSFKQFKSKIGD